MKRGIYSVPVFVAVILLNVILVGVFSHSFAYSFKVSSHQSVLSGIVMHEEGDDEDGDNGDDNDDNDDNNDDKDKDKDKDDGDSEDNSGSNDSEDGDKDDDSGEDSSKKESENEYILSDGTKLTVKIKSEIKDGETKYEEERIYTDSNGNKIRVKITEETRNEDGKEKVKTKLVIDDFEVESELKIKQSDKNDSKMKVQLSDGSEEELNVLPSQIAEIASEKLKIKAEDIRFSLNESNHKNVPSVVYHVLSNKNGKFLGIFKMTAKIEATVDPSNGEIIDSHVPWWAFLLVSDKEEPITCTADSQICPDGSSVGRDPNNNCEFIACPVPVN